MAYVLLLSKADFTEDKIIPQSTDDARVEKSIRDAQDFDLKPLLGDALFLDLMNNLTAPNYIALMDGGEYVNAAGDTVFFSGLRRTLKYYAYARYLPVQKMNVTTHSIVEKLNQYSQPTEDKSILREAEASRSGAVVYWSETKEYLNTKKADFPLWKCTNRPARGSIKITSIGGNN